VADDTNGYRDAKKKVADRVPAQDWSFIGQEDPESYLQKSEGKWGGHLKQVVAISANGRMKGAAPRLLLLGRPDLILDVDKQLAEPLAVFAGCAQQAVIEAVGRQENVKSLPPQGLYRLVEVAVVPEQRKVPGRDAALIFPPGVRPPTPPQPWRPASPTPRASWLQAHGLPLAWLAISRMTALRHS
jgi:hypothetical protein